MYRRMWRVRSAASGWLLTSMALTLEARIWQGAATAEIRDRLSNLELTGLRRHGTRWR